jgi:hypothetical protein
MNGFSAPASRLSIQSKAREGKSRQLAAARIATASYCRPVPAILAQRSRLVHQVQVDGNKHSPEALNTRRDGFDIGRAPIAASVSQGASTPWTGNALPV